jgi:hypothetical protein
MKSTQAESSVVLKHKYMPIRAMATFSAGVLMCAVMLAIDLAVNLELRAESQSVKPAFASKGKDEYIFDTGVLRGELRKDGQTLGLSSVVHIPSGTKLDGRFGIFSYYRIFTTNKRYGHAAWEWPSESKLLPDGAVQIVWPAEKDHPFEMTATYGLADETTLDVQTLVKAQTDLPRFEVFLASYFREIFPTPCVYVGGNPQTEGKPGFLAAEKSFGDWQMFPKNEQALPMIHDGRWQKEPNPVKWTIMPYMAAPIGVRLAAGAGVTIVLMAPPDDCFAISTPYEGENHYSLYLSLFGRDVKAGETVESRSRLVVTTAVSNDQILGLYKKYLKELRGSAPSSTGP